MKIVIIPSADLSYNSGSVIYAKKLFQYLLDKGNEVYMLGNCMPVDIKEEYKKNIKVKSNLLFHPIIDDRPILDVQYLDMGMDILLALKEIYDEWGQIDVIHAHYASVNSFAATFFSEFIGIPVVVSSFGRDINIGYKTSLLLKKLIEDSLEKVDKIVVPDLALKAKIEQMILGEKCEKIEICPMPIDEEILVAGDYIKNNNGEIILSTINSCFTIEKGIDNIITAFSYVLRQNDNCRLYIAGQDDDEQKTNYMRLKKLMSELELNDKVTFTGYLSRNEVGELLNATDIFIDARTKGDFSSVLLEAQFKNKAVIVSNNEASRKIITQGYNGLLFDKGNAKELANKIIELINNEDELKKLEAGAKCWVENDGKEYREEICMNKMLRIYKDISR